MDLKELRQMNKSDMLKELKEKRKKLQELRFKISLEEHAQVRDYRKLRKDIAQILTVLKEKDNQVPADEKSLAEEGKGSKTKEGSVSK